MTRDHASLEWTLNDLRKSLKKEVNAMESGESIDNLNEDYSSFNVAPTALFFTKSTRSFQPPMTSNPTTWKKRKEKSQVYILLTGTPSNRLQFHY